MAPVAPVADEAPFSTDNAAAAFRHFLPVAQALPAEDVPVRGGDVTVARANVERGVEAIRPHLERVPQILPLVSVNDLLELPALALALVHADGRVPAAASAREIDAALGKVGPLREMTLSYLEVAAQLGIVPAQRVRAIRSGKGKLDVARDCVDIAGLFEEAQADLAGKHPFTEAQIAELATTGTWLVQHITPRGTAKGPATRDAAALIRDRFWKLLEDRHDDLRTVGVALFGIKGVDEQVPPLLSRSSAPRTQAAAETQDTAQG